MRMQLMIVMILVTMILLPIPITTSAQNHAAAKTRKSQAVVKPENPVTAMARVYLWGLVMAPQVAAPTCQTQRNHRHCLRLRCHRLCLHADSILELGGYSAALTVWSVGEGSAY